jgi:hypothetical protein
MFSTVYGCCYGCVEHELLEKHFDAEMKMFTIQQLSLAIDRLKQIRSAHYWIERRKMLLGEILGEQLKAVRPEDFLLENCPLADSARAEATVVPKKKVVRNTPVEIKLFGDEVRAMFPYRDKEFWDIIKRVLEFEWTGECWRKTTDMTGTTLVDLAAEAGNALLNAGYRVRIWDEVIRKKAVSGDYNPQRTRWIFVDDQGNFAIKSNYYDDLYDDARKIAGSKYKKPYVRVVPTEFPELLDFAELFEFSFTNEALELIAEQERIAAEITLADVAPVSTRKKKRGRQMLNAADVGDEIHEDLRDD